MSTLSFGPVKAPNTFDVLANVLRERLPQFGFESCTDPTAAQHLRVDREEQVRARIIWEVSHGSGQDAYAADVDRSDAVFALNDPNAITGWAMTDEFTTAVCRAKFVRMLHTMGCNVGGIKRLEPALRQQWFQFITRAVVALHNHHDLILRAIERDASQWAYMLRTASRWKQSNSDQMREGV